LVDEGRRGEGDGDEDRGGEVGGEGMTRMLVVRMKSGGEGRMVDRVMRRRVVDKVVERGYGLENMMLLGGGKATDLIFQTLEV